MNTLIIFGAQYLYLVIVFAVIVYLLCQPKNIQKKILLSLLIVLPATYVIAKIMSYFYYDPRPFVMGNFAPLLPHENDNGFPSDHTLLSSALAVTLFFFSRKGGYILLGIALLVGISRVFSGIHHFVDIAGSIVIASLVSYIFFVFLFPKIEKKFPMSK